jgi:hypothetical protein
VCWKRVKSSTLKAGLAIVREAKDLSQCQPGVVGCSGQDLYSVRAAGQYCSGDIFVIRCALSRPWEAASIPPVQTLEFRIRLVL